jgi:hypothetical protein
MQGRKDSFCYEYNLGISAAFESTNLEIAEGDQNRQRANNGRCVAAL